ncbi:MAG: hypothetical protein IJ554_04420 [Paludibacteraceae bacterium]|nr:hypothetical protein [Paludibacteraceae bacterium]
MKYPLLPYSQLVFDMLKTNPDVYATRFGVRVAKREVDVSQLKQAIETALRNHPVFSMRIDEKGMQWYEPQSNIFHGPYHTIDFCEEGETIRIDIAYNRILGDGKSELILFEDICRAYQGLPLQPDIYLKYLKQVEQEKLSPSYAENRRALEAEFDAISCPAHPKTDIPLEAEANPIEGLLQEDYGALYLKLNAFSQTQILPITAIFSLASALAIMEYNGTYEAALTWAYEGRETQEEQRIYGSLHRDVPFKINHKSKIINHKSDLIRLARNQIRSGIAHSSYPYTLTPPHTEIWNYALNVLVRPTVDDMEESIPFPIEPVSSSNESQPAYALLDVEIHEHPHDLSIWFRYSATHYKESSIRRFAALVRKYAEWLIK